MCRDIADDLSILQINNFASHLAGLYSNIAKPVLDLMLFSNQLSKNVGAEGLIGLAILIQSSSALRASRLGSGHCQRSLS